MHNTLQHNDAQSTRTLQCARYSRQRGIADCTCAWIHIDAARCVHAFSVTEDYDTTGEPQSVLETREVSSRAPYTARSRVCHRQNSPGQRHPSVRRRSSASATSVGRASSSCFCCPWSCRCRRCRRCRRRRGGVREQIRRGHASYPCSSSWLAAAFPALAAGLAFGGGQPEQGCTRAASGVEGTESSFTPCKCDGRTRYFRTMAVDQQRPNEANTTGM